MVEEKRATIRSVATAAGVSPATVSFVLNNTPRQTIPEETRERVRAAAAELNYTPNRIARTLREGRSRLVLLKAGGFRGGSSLDSLIHGMELELASHSYRLIVTYGDDGPDAELLDTVAPHTVMDLSTMYSSTNAALEDGDWIDGLASHTAAQLRHLLDSGHRRIALAMPLEPRHAQLAALRNRHVAEFASQECIPPPAVLKLPPDPEDAAAVLERFRTNHPAVTALAAYDDHTAFTALAAAARLGVRVPQDVAVIGFDETPYARLWAPPLTSVWIDAAEFGRRAARRALDIDVGDWRGSPSRVTPRATV